MKRTTKVRDAWVIKRMFGPGLEEIYHVENGCWIRERTGGKFKWRFWGDEDDD